MYPKNKIEKLIKKYARKFERQLLLDYHVTYHVIHSKSKNQNPKWKFNDEKAKVHFKENGRYDANVIIYYDQTHSERDALASLVHELLHLRLVELTEKTYKPRYILDEYEEIIVRILEKWIIKLMLK